MAFSDENMVMPVAPAYGGNNGGMFGNGDSWAWIILLLLLAGNGWGNNGYGCNGGVNGLYPWLNQAEATNAGFQNSALNSAINGIQSSITSGFGDVQNSLCNGFSQAEISANSRQMANMNQIYGISTQLAQCCCDNRLATAQTQALVQSENCADRQALSDGIRDIIVNQTSNTQRILDQMCADKIDAKNEKIVELQNQLNMATLRESQTAQNALITQGFATEVDALYNRLSNCPVPTTPVYGRTPIFTCQNNGCGCGSF